jgi:hypothetical protein
MGTLLTQQPTTPAISTATLREVLTAAIARHPELTAKLERAAAIMAYRRILPGLAAGWWVESASTPGTEYHVIQRSDGAWACTCPDYVKREQTCKHAYAVRLLHACQRREARLRAAMERHPAPAPACAPPEVRYELTAQGEAYLRWWDAQAATSNEPVPAA